MLMVRLCRSQMQVPPIGELRFVLISTRVCVDQIFDLKDPLFRLSLLMCHSLPTYESLTFKLQEMLSECVQGGL